MRLFHRSFLAGFLLALPVALSLADPPLRIGPVDGVTDSWHSLPNDIELPLGVTVQLEFSWGLNRADVNADGRVDLLDYATLSLCFSAPGGRQPGACDAGSYRAADLDDDGDVDIYDANALSQAIRNPQPFAVESVTWIGAHQVSRTASRTRAEIDLREPGQRVVRVDATMTDPITQRTTRRSREITIHVVDSPATEFTADWTRKNTPAIRGSTDPAIQLFVNAFNPQGKPLDALNVGDQVLFEVGATVDPSYTALDTAGPGGNRGLATLVYNVNSAEAAAKGYFLSPMEDADSGFGVSGEQKIVSSSFYMPSLTSVQAQYGGGWGFDRSGFQGGGDLTSAGQIVAAGVAAPLVFLADVNPNYPGLQPNARLDVGAGLYTFPPDDPIVGGLQGGFGQDFSNTANPLPGDGTWMFQTGLIDTTGWVQQQYNLEIILSSGGVALYDNLDYSQDISGGFRKGVPANELGNATFSFTLGTADCNFNGVPDDQDILGGTSADCNSNSIPDECESGEDCNANGILDACDTTQGTSDDCNSNGIPDECEPNEDCNGNSIRDICDIGQGTSTDCNFNAAPDECDPTGSSVLFVNASATGANTGESWTNAFAGLQDALAAAECYGGFVTEIWVAAGTYTPDRGTGDRNMSFELRNSLALYGGFDGSETLRDQRDSGANTTTLSGDLAGNDGPDFENYQENSLHVVIAESEINTSAVLDAFTVTGGAASGGGFRDPRGAGIFTLGSPTLAKCIVTKNRATTGAGMYCQGSPQVENCTFKENVADSFGGGVTQSGGDPRFSSCLFLRNTASGGSGGGMVIAPGPSPDSLPSTATLIGCSFVGNLASGSQSAGGGLAIFSDLPSLINCVFTGNANLLGDGGAVGTFGSITMTNCTLAGNSAPQGSGGGVFIGTQELVILNNAILWNNDDSDGIDESSQVHLDSNDFTTGMVSMDYSCVRGLTGQHGGTGNIGVDPIFVDADGPDDIIGTLDDNLSLSAGSPCVDAADNAAVPAGVTSDIHGGPRFVDDPDKPDTGSGTPPIVDMGADERADCNSNGIDDHQDIFGGTSDDCNANGVPDECEPVEDCNGNGVQDICDIAFGTSDDCNANGIPDECGISAGTTEDCNGNGVPDACDITAGTSQECNANGVPDECELAENDCNSNGIPDECEADCNANDIIDECDIEAGSSLDCNANGVPDECDTTLLGVYFVSTHTADFGWDTPNRDSGFLIDNTLDYLWPVEANSGPILLIWDNTAWHDSWRNALDARFIPFIQLTGGAVSAADFDPATYTMIVITEFMDDTSLPNVNSLVSEMEAYVLAGGVLVDMIATNNTRRWSQGVPGPFGTVTDRIHGNDSYIEVPGHPMVASMNGPVITHNGRIPIPPASSLVILTEGTTPGGLATAAILPTSNDCNMDGVPDECQLAANDCNNNSVPDECEPVEDCNANGAQDSCDLALGTSEDCNTNGVPDECELTTGTSLDCNSNGVPDECDIAPGTSQDCGSNGIPDECESAEDCNGNGVQDFCDLALGTSQDCNFNDIPDECESGEDCNVNGILDACDMAQGTSADCNSNDIPDECEPDCNSSGIPDECDIAAGTSQDCNASGVPDECELAENDCNANGVPDECEPNEDCNGNGAQDFCDLALGTSEDCQEDGIPDECQLTDNDCNASGTPDECDIAESTSKNCNGNSIPDECELLDNDCNSNDIPDECELADTFEAASSQLSPIHFNAPQSFTIASPPLASEDVVLDFIAQTDLGFSSEFINVDINGTPVGMVFDFSAGDCVTLTDQLIVPAAVFNNALAGGDATINMVASTAVNSFCVGSFVSVTATYDALVVGDCNSNAVPDDCDVALGASQDCNANGVPDECDLGGPFLAASPHLSPIHFNAPQVFTIASPPLASQDVVLDFLAQTDLGFSVEFINVDINGAQVGVVFDFSGIDCVSFTDQLTVPAEVFNSAVAGGDATINMIASSNVNDFCTGSFVSVTVTYDAIGIGDCNSNGVPDECEPDCNANGVPDDCDLDAGTSEDCNANTFPDECDIAAGNSSDAGGNAVPDECEARLDIKPASCPNSFNRNSHGVLPVALVGAAAFDVSNVDLSTVLLSRADGAGGTVAPHEGPPGPHTVTEDVATPSVGQSCDCHTLTADGFTDLSMKFRTDDLVPALELDTLPAGALVELVVSGTLLDGSEFVASDCVRLVPPGTGPGMLTVNSNLPQAWIDIAPLDTQLDGGGFGAFDRTWPQSTVVTFSAEEFYQGQRFVGWKFDGEFLGREMTAAVTVRDWPAQANPEPQTIDAVFRRTGDITGDELINLNDFAMFAVCFGKSWGSNLSGACSNEALASADLDRNGVIDLRDFAIFAIHFGT